MEDDKLSNLARDDIESCTNPGISGKRLHEIINNRKIIKEIAIAGAIIAHEAQNFSEKQNRKCWDDDYVQVMLSHSKYYSMRSAVAIAGLLRLHLTYPNARNEALALISRFDYPKIEDNNLRGRFYSVAGYTKLNNKLFPIDEPIRDFNDASIAFLKSGNKYAYFEAKMELVKAKMNHDVYEKYRGEVDKDLSEAYTVIDEIEKSDSLIGSFYHTRGLHICNTGTMNNDVEMIKMALTDFKKAREHKLAHIGTANSYASTTKITGDVALRLALKYNDRPIENLAFAKDMYLETFRTKSDLAFDDYKDLIYAYWVCLKAINKMDEFIPTLEKYNNIESTNPNFKAAIQYTFSVIERKD